MSVQAHVKFKLFPRFVVLNHILEHCNLGTLCTTHLYYFLKGQNHVSTKILTITLSSPNVLNNLVLDKILTM